MRSAADSGMYFMVFTAVTLALITLLNVVGLNIGKWLNNAGAIGSGDSGDGIDRAGCISFFKFGAATHFAIGSMVPRPGMKNLIFLSTIFFAFGGCEAGSIYGR